MVVNNFHFEFLLGKCLVTKCEFEGSIKASLPFRFSDVSRLVAELYIYGNDNDHGYAQDYGQENEYFQQYRFTLSLAEVLISFTSFKFLIVSAAIIALPGILKRIVRQVLALIFVFSVRHITVSFHFVYFILVILSLVIRLISSNS